MYGYPISQKIFMNMDKFPNDLIAFSMKCLGIFHCASVLECLTWVSLSWAPAICFGIKF